MTECSGSVPARYSNAEDIPVLLDMGKEHIFVWEENPNEIHEEDAARTVLEAAAGPGTCITGPAEGKFSLRAECDGLFLLNSEALYLINSVPDYSFASLPQARPVRRGEALVGARIVPLVTASDRVEQARRIALERAPVFQVRPYRPRKTGYVITGSEIYYGRIHDAFRPILDQKLLAYGVTDCPYILCPDDLEKICSAVAELEAQGCELILMTGGMSVDPDDLTPSAIRRLCQDLVFQGLPIQPGNMLTSGAQPAGPAAGGARGLHARPRHRLGRPPAQNFCRLGDLP